MRSRAAIVLTLGLGLGLLVGGCPPVAERPDSGPPYDPVAGNPFDGPISFDDARVHALDVSRIPSGPGECPRSAANPDLTPGPRLGVVDRIVDGDTIHVVVPSDMREYDVRLIGVNAPEIAHGDDGGPPADCFGDESHAFTELLRGRSVVLTFDPDCEDDFGRLLAYVWIGGGEGDMWQRQMLERGYARTLSIAPDTTFEAEFETRRAGAEAAGLGMWSCP